MARLVEGLDTLYVGQCRDYLRIVNDQVCTPTYVPHLAEAIMFLIGTTSYGTFHVTNQGGTSWADLAVGIFRQTDMHVDIERITTDEYGAPAPRPNYSVLDTSKYHALGEPPMPDRREALAEYLSDRVDGIHLQ